MTHRVMIEIDENAAEQVKLYKIETCNVYTVVIGIIFVNDLHELLVVIFLIFKNFTVKYHSVFMHVHLTSLPNKYGF